MNELAIHPTTHGTDEIAGLLWLGPDAVSRYVMRPVASLQLGSSTIGAWGFGWLGCFWAWGVGVFLGLGGWGVGGSCSRNFFHQVECSLVQLDAECLSALRPAGQRIPHPEAHETQRKSASMVTSFMHSPKRQVRIPNMNLGAEKVPIFVDPRRG